MKIERVNKVVIKTPYGVATIQKLKWKSSNKSLEMMLNREFNENHPNIRSEHIRYGMANFILADQAIRKYGGKITRKVVRIANIRDENPS